MSTVKLIVMQQFSLLGKEGFFFFCHLSLSPSLFQNTSEFSYVFGRKGWVNSFSSVNSFKEEKNLKVIVAMETNF